MNMEDPSSIGEWYEERTVLDSISADFGSLKHGNCWSYLLDILRENFRKLERCWNNNWHLLDNCWVARNSFWNAF